MATTFSAIPLVDPLPIYSRDPETASIRSAAPSYVSDAPTYTSSTLPEYTCREDPPTRPTTSRQTTATSSTERTGLPARRYAPGYESRAHGSIRDLESHNYNVANWSSITTSHASKQYENVARRRVMAMNEMNNSTAALLSTLSPTVLSNPAAAAAMVTAANSMTNSTTINNHTTSSTRSSPTSSIENLSSFTPTPPSLTRRQTSPTPLPAIPHSPHEDPELVGHAAAARAREARLYREYCMGVKKSNDDTMRRNEARSWDFMLSQMADWEEREKSWAKFRSEVSSTRLLGRRLGLRR